MTAIPTSIFETPADAAARHLRLAQISSDGLHRVLEERRTCFKQGLYYAAIGLGEMAASRISYLGGMAGEW
ncbi:hypothetical protein [Collimonas antrihumi]|uniref:hypothetical protein n=1 Tax=Collimonas antrihumi TaxID=1940615 RepID=UPI001B8D1662|nr:hypothetical protein [Collimonas antrihumi]